MEILDKLTHEKVTINFHENCLTPANFTKYLWKYVVKCLIIIFRYHMEKFWTALSFNYDSNHVEYLSTIEARNYPFVGTQFHPEKNIFEWALNSVKNIPHNR